MKKKITGLVNYVLLTSLAFGTFLLIGFACSGNDKKQVKQPIRNGINDKVIVEQQTDERGLTSVLFYYSLAPSDTFAYDYLSRKEYDSIFIVSVEYFKDGQILLPDYACPDTLIVMDAETLNRNFAYVEQDISWGSDADCDSLLHCLNKQGLAACMTFEQYLTHLDGEGYRADIAFHIASVEFGRIAPDQLYKSIKED